MFNGVIDVVFQVGDNKNELEVWDWKYARGKPWWASPSYGKALNPIGMLSVTRENYSAMQVAFYAWMLSVNEPHPWISSCYVATAYSRSNRCTINKVSEAIYIMPLMHLVNKRFNSTILYLDKDTPERTYVIQWRRKYKKICEDRKSYPHGSHI
jgi:hypothetical protein